MVSLKTLQEMYPNQYRYSHRHRGHRGYNAIDHENKNNRHRLLTGDTHTHSSTLPYRIRPGHHLSPFNLCARLHSSNSTAALPTLSNFPSLTNRRPSFLNRHFALKPSFLTTANSFAISKTTFHAFSTFSSSLLLVSSSSALTSCTPCAMRARRMNCVGSRPLIISLWTPFIV